MFRRKSLQVTTYYYVKQKNTGSSFALRKGKLNDYLFKALLQINNEVLKHLTCVLKHLKPEEVKSVTIENPIALGKLPEDKIFILDIRMLLNDDSVINYEMQTYWMANWEERSLLYLCRAFDDIRKGGKYREVREVTHIGFLDFTLFPEKPEFYATYKMANVKNHNVYTDKLTISVVDLSRIDLATAEDRAWHIDYWAALFKATTWEEIKMLSEKDEMIREAAETVYELSGDRAIRDQCRAREDYLRQMDYYEQKMAKMAKLEKENAEKTAEAERYKEELVESKEEIARLKKLLAEKE